MDELQELKKRVKELEKENALFKTDGIVGYYFSLQRKLNELAVANNNYKVSFSDEGRDFERFLKSWTDSLDLIKSISELERIIKEKYGDVDDAEKKSSNHMEDLVGKINATLKKK